MNGMPLHRWSGWLDPDYAPLRGTPFRRITYDWTLHCYVWMSGIDLGRPPDVTPVDPEAFYAEVAPELEALAVESPAVPVPDHPSARAVYEILLEYGPMSAADIAIRLERHMSNVWRQLRAYPDTFCVVRRERIVNRDGIARNTDIWGLGQTARQPVNENSTAFANPLAQTAAALLAERGPLTIPDMASILNCAESALYDVLRRYSSYFRARAVSRVSKTKHRYVVKVWELAVPPASLSSESE